MKLLTILILLKVAKSDHLEHLYCNFPCGTLHTLCRREYLKCGKNARCGYHNEVTGLPSDKDRKKFITLHNIFRNKVALGKEPNEGSSEASNMMALSYSFELEFIAQCWANACKSEKDRCRSTNKYLHVGQNIYYSKEESSTIEIGIKSWFKHIYLLENSMVDSFQNTTDARINTVSQILWAETVEIGCGSLNFEGSHLLICNYGPAGNVNNASIYKKGKSCSNCPNNIRCNHEYPGLCGNVYKNNFKPPFLFPNSLGSILNYNIMFFYWCLLENLMILYVYIK